VISVGWDEVRTRRLARSSLLDRADAGRLTNVVRNLAGVHAQVQASAELQLAARVDGISRGDVRAALWERRELVKAWTLRGTLHLHAGDELALWHAARRTTEPARAGVPAWRDPNGVEHPPLGADEAAAVRAAVWDVLDGRCLLREELTEEVVQRVGPAARSRLRSGFAFFIGDLCHGPPQGTKITLARPDQWLGGWTEIDGRLALREAARRYLTTYGPARPSDFREWIGGSAFAAADVRAVFADLELEDVDVEGRQAHVLAGDTAFPEPRPSVRLLPEYDVYVMGFRERDHLLPDAVREQIASHGRGRYEGPAGVRLLVLDGVAAGIWQRKQRGKRIELTISPARKLTKLQRVELAAEAERIGACTGLEPLVTVL
jgi:hypothetical protein